MSDCTVSNIQLLYKSFPLKRPVSTPTSKKKITSSFRKTIWYRFYMSILERCAVNWNHQHNKSLYKIVKMRVGYRYGPQKNSFNLYVLTGFNDLRNIKCAYPYIKALCLKDNYLSVHANKRGSRRSSCSKALRRRLKQLY